LHATNILYHDDTLLKEEKMKKLVLLVLVLSLVLPMFAAGTSEEAKAYPSRNVRVIIPWSVGGMTDVLTRPIASALEKEFGVPFVVENKPGGGGVVGSLEIENAKADGYVIGTTSMSTVSAKYVSPMYPDIHNVKLISQVITIPATVTVSANSPFKTVQELIEYAKANPGKLKNSNSGTGASAHIYASYFEALAGIKMNHIPYPAYAEAITALLGDHVDLTNIPLPDVAPHVDAGKLRLLAIASAERHPSYPDVPTLKELGIDAVMGNYSGFVAPKGMDPAQVETIDKAIGKIMQDPKIRKFLIDAGYQPVYLNAKDFAQVIADAEKQLEYLVNELGITFIDD
jgi:tripartite-type tricarboxylate transporter receptor subunit TctC